MRLRVILRRDRKSYTKSVHTLVLEAFVGKRPFGLEACHNDGNCQNNKVENLRWDTRQSNINDSVRHGTKTKPPRFSGESHPNMKLTNAQIVEIRNTFSNYPTKAAIARQYGISNNHVNRILSGECRPNAGS